MNESDEAFAAWLKANYQTAGGAPILAKAAWDAATERARQLAFDTAKRYTCSKRRALCFAIADQIKRDRQ